MISSKPSPKFDYLCLSRFVEENLAFLVNARVQKIQQPTRQELLLTLRGLGETKKLYININPKFFHLCFTSSENEQKRLITNPQKPPMFCMLLRKYIESARIAKVIQPPQERILELYFETYNELGEKIYLCLAIELMGKHSNVVLYNYDTNMILGCAHNVGAEKSSVREVIGGLPYAYPPKATAKAFWGLSDLLKESESVNDFIDNHFADLQEKDKIKDIKTKLCVNTKAKIKKINTSLEKIKKQSATDAKADSYRKKGDLIMANLFNNKDFEPNLEVFDYETNSALKIELDKTKTLKENANQYYKLYNKVKTANSKTQELVEKMNSEKEYLEQVLYSVEGAQTTIDLLEIEEEIFPNAKNKKDKNKKEKSAVSPLTMHISPFTVFVGKNNKQNDYIVSKLARSEDIWLHAHNCAGSHVLLRVESGVEATDEIIFKCAQLAKEYSVGKNSSKVGIIYTKAKNLKKPPGANLGYVTYKGEKEIIVD